jgi:UDP:flavonoid glycosyltransferase YjiC (YdhE family)
VAASGAEAKIYDPLDYRMSYIPKLPKQQNPDFISNEERAEINKLWKEFVKEETEHSLSQLQEIYRNDRPDLIVYDLRNLAGRELAKKWNIPKIEHSPMTIGGQDKEALDHSYDENLVLVSVPKFFQENAEKLDDRFHFIGPVFEDLKPRLAQPRDDRDGVILVSGATAGLPSLEPFELAIRAFEGVDCRVILSSGNRIDLTPIGALASNFEIDRSSSHPELLKRARLFVSHGGQTSTLEALYQGVSLLVIPAGPVGSIYDVIGGRVAELGLGIRLRRPEASPEKVREQAVLLLEDEGTLSRVRRVQKLLHEGNNAHRVVDLIDQYLTE